MGYFDFVWHFSEICVINAPSGQLTEIAVLVIISIKPLVLHQTPESQEALWHNHFRFFLSKTFLQYKNKLGGIHLQDFVMVYYWISVQYPKKLAMSFKFHKCNLEW